MMSHVARLFRLTYGPNGVEWLSSGCQYQYSSRGAVACCMSVSADRASPIHATPRAVSRRPCRFAMARADQKMSRNDAPRTRAPAVAAGSTERARAGPVIASGGASRYSARSMPADPGDSARRTRAGSGTTVNAASRRQAMRAPSSSRFGAVRIGGRSRAATRMAPPTSGTVVHVYAPANANRVHAASSTSAVEPLATLDGRFCVVVLVLVPVVPRIVVLVAREIDPVEHDGAVARP